MLYCLSRIPGINRLSGNVRQLLRRVDTDVPNWNDSGDLAPWTKTNLIASEMMVMMMIMVMMMMMIIIIIIITTVVIIVVITIIFIIIIITVIGIIIYKGMNALLLIRCIDLSGPCITNVFATCRKNFSQWERSFLWKLRCHWLKFLRRVAKTLVIQGPVVLVVYLNVGTVRALHCTNSDRVPPVIIVSLS